MRTNNNKQTQKNAQSERLPQMAIVLSCVKVGVETKNGKENFEYAKHSKVVIE